MKNGFKNEFETFFTADIESSLKNCFEKGGVFTVYPKGTSMLPTIREGKDCVTLAPFKHIIKNGIYLYKRPNGKYAMHRLVKITKNNLIFCGDAQIVYENVKREQILAYADGIYTGKKRRDTRFFQKLFVSLNSVFLFRKIVIRLRSLKKRLRK